MKITASIILIAMNATYVMANTAIETETAQLGKQGELAFSQSIEYEKAKDGSAFGTLTQFEYALSDRAEILIEPFFHLWEKPDGGPNADGQGDLEITPSYMVVTEDTWLPAILVALKVKVPTGSENVGGSGKYDYFPYLIFGQHYGNWTFNANIGVNYANTGKKYDTPFSHKGTFEKRAVWDLEAETEIYPNVTSFIEVYSAEDGIKTISTALQYQLGKHSNIFLALAYNKDNSIIIRPGFNLEF